MPPAADGLRERGMIWSTLLLGLLLGIKHATEADHVVALASLATRSPSRRDIVRMGATWGLGHALTLFAVGIVVLALGTAMPPRLALALECVVGVVLIGLGADLLRHAWRVRKGGGSLRAIHGHTHSTAPGAAGGKRLSLRMLLVGSVHGMAGSAALTVLALQTIGSVPLGLAYIALFGLGSVAGMAAFSLLIALPLRSSAVRTAVAESALHGAVGALTVALGAWVVFNTTVLHGLLA